MNPDNDFIPTEWRIPDGDLFYERFKKNGELYSYTLGSWKIAERFLPHRRVAIDVGAHIGTFTLRYAQNFEQVLAVEPMYCNELLHNIKKCDNVIWSHATFSDHTGFLTMKCRTINSGRSEVMKNPKEKLNDKWYKRETFCNTMDDIIEEHMFEHIDFIKIDVENYNLPVLVGGEKTIMKHKPLIQIELPDNFDQNARRWLVEHGYRQVAEYDVDKFFQYG